MQKMGVKKLKNKEFKFYTKEIQSKYINLKHKNIKDITSTFLNSDILDVEFLDNINNLKIIIKNIFKFIYSTHYDNNLYFYEKDFISVSYLEIPKSIEGLSSKLAFLQKKIKPELYIENVESKLLNDDIILVHFCMIIIAKIKPSYYLGFNIDNDLFENIFLSHIDASNLTQKTFTTSTKYKNLKWSPDASLIVFIGEDTGNYYIYFINLNSKSNCFDFIFIDGIANSFSFISSNEIVVSINKKDENKLYKLNLSNKKFKNIGICSNNQKGYIKPCFDKYFKRIYSICDIDNKQCLCYLQNTNFKILFDYFDVYDYEIGPRGSKIGIITLKDDLKKIFIYDAISGFLNPVNFEVENGQILKIKFFKDSILILYKCLEKYYISLYDITNLVIKNVFSSENIIDFEADIDSLDIFIVLRNNMFSEVIKLNLDNKKTILKIPSNIKSLTLRNEG